MQDIISINGEIALENGDFLIQNSDAQHLEFLLQSFQGEWKNHPTAGCNLLNSKNASIDRFMDRNIRVQLETDGFLLEKMTITQEGIAIQGTY